MLRCSHLILLVYGLLNSSVLFAHSEGDKTRFVAVEGNDIGRCDNVLRPCKTITYAVKQANKGDKILLSSGKYSINSNDELFYLKSSIVPILGGYNRFDHYQSQSPQSNITSLVGVPQEMNKELALKGFTVISDGKGVVKSKAFKEKIAAYYNLNKQQSEEPCINNNAAGFSCNNVDLLAHMPLGDFSSKPSGANDIWGHVDLNTNKEYALIGLRNGVAVVDVSEPTAPIEVGTISGKSTTWRDIKVYQYYDDATHTWRAYAYVTIDGATDYVTIVDLNNLPNSITLVERNKAAPQAHNVYISNLDYSLNIALPGMIPTLQLIGTPRVNTHAGAFHSYSLDNPETITSLSENAAGNGYTHDGASMYVTNNAGCKKNSECTVFIDFNENEMKLWDITDNANYQQLSSISYDNVKYTHSGWSSEDQQYIFLHDELDEKNASLNTTVRVFSVSDLANPQQVGEWVGSTTAIDHNGFVRGNRYYMSNYAKGLTVLDISNPTAPVEIGNFDTYPTSDDNVFNGAWGTYPFLPSGNILVSDINSGLYILKDNTLASSQGTLSFSSQSTNTAQGQNLLVNVQRTGINNLASTVTVDYEIIPGSAKQNVDYTSTKGTLTWVGNDSSSQSFVISIADDSNDEELQESFYVRLYNPQNGATISSPSYLTVNLDGKTDNGAIGFTKNSIIVAENQQSVVVDIGRMGSSVGIISVNYELQSASGLVGSDIEQNSGTLTWQDGNADNQTITLTLIDDELLEENENLNLVLTSIGGSRLGSKDQLTVTIADDESNTPPTVSLTENFQVNTSQTLSLTAIVADAENDPLTYLWSQTSGDAIDFTVNNELTTSFVTANRVGTIEIAFTATDSKGKSTTKSVTLTIVAPTIPVAQSSSGGGQYWLLLLLFPLIMRKSYHKLVCFP
jgi:choice-of-anchor B domain-containing protein